MCAPRPSRRARASAGRARPARCRLCASAGRPIRGSPAPERRGWPCPGNLKVDAAYKGFAVETDQPMSGGGDGAAPAPFDLFLASLGTCAGIFMLAFMKQRGIDPAGSGIAMTTEADPQKGMIGRIAFDSRLPEGFPEKNEQAIVRAVDQCTVKRRVQDPPEFAVTTSRGMPG